MATKPYKKRKIPWATRRAVAIRYGGRHGESTEARCAYCGKAGTINWTWTPGWVHFSGLELDHVVPEFLGGTAQPENIVLACAHCNRSRGHRVIGEPRFMPAYSRVG